MSRSAARAAASLGALVAGLVACLGPGLASAAPVAAATVAPAASAGSGATFVLRTVPVIRGVRVVLDGTMHTTNAHGRVSIGTTPGPHHVHILPPRVSRAGPRVRFARWVDGIAFANRTITLSPGANRVEAGFIFFRPVAVRFTDEHGLPVPMREVSRLTLANSVGQRFTFSPPDPPQALPANRVVRDLTGLVPLPIRYSVRDVVIDNSNVVYGGSQSFFVTSSHRIWTIKVLLFPLRIEVRDALFRFPIGSAVELMLPSHARRLVTLGPDHSVLLTGLPRATYQLVAKGLGIGMTSPTTLSKPQVAKVLLFSWIDVAAVLGFVVLFVVGLPLVGGRIVRRHGRFRLPVWHGGEPSGLAQAEPAEAGSGSAGTAAEPPQQPRPAAANPASAGSYPASAGPARAAAHGARGPAVDAPGEGGAPDDSAGPGQGPGNAAAAGAAPDDSAAPSEAPGGEITLPDTQRDAAADPDSWDNTDEIPVVADVMDGPGISQLDPGKADDLAATPASGGARDRVAERREES
jgi:hypothetical protein